MINAYRKFGWGIYIYSKHFGWDNLFTLYIIKTVPVVLKNGLVRGNCKGTKKRHKRKVVFKNQK